MINKNEYINMTNESFLNPETMAVSRAISTLTEEERAFALSYIGLDCLKDVLKSKNNSDKYCMCLKERSEAMTYFFNKTIEIVEKMSNNSHKETFISKLYKK